MATRGKLQDCQDRIQQADADDNLKQLVRDCLALEPSERPRDSSVVASRLNEHLESVEQRLRQSELDAIEAHTRATEERKRRRVLAALAASVILLMTTMGGGWIWTQHQQERIDQIEVRRTQAIQKEIATAKALGSSTESDNPDPQLIARALEAIGRAERELKRGNIKGNLAAQIAQVRKRLETQLHDATLIEELESIWEFEIQQLAEQSESSTNPLQPANWGVSIDSAADTEERYQRAFTKWGLQIGSNDSGFIRNRTESLPKEHQTTVIVSLERWKRLLDSPPDLAFWDQANWIPLRSVSRTSRGGDQLELLEDGSILASGDHPEFGYELVYECSETEVSALRLETLLDNSLPMRGPGRGPRGQFSMQGPKIYFASKSNPHDKTRLELRHAVADHAAAKWPLSVDQWHIGGGAGKPHRAVYELAKPIKSDDGLLVFIETGDRSAPKPWDSQNLGRFRWSVCKQEFQVGIRTQLASLLNQLPKDPWRIQLGLKAATRDVAGLRQLALSPEFEDQPSIVQVELAEALMNASDGFQMEDLPPEDEWKRALPVLNPSETMEAIVLEDNSFRATHSDRSSDRYQFSTGDTQKKLSGLLLELISDDKLPGGGVSTENGKVYVSEMTFSRLPRGRSETRSLIRIANAYSNVVDGNASKVEQALDKNLATNWIIPIVEERQALAFFAFEEPIIVGPEDLLEVEWQYDSWARINQIGRFRLSIIEAPFELNDARSVALQMLQQMQCKKPDDYWVNLSLAQTFNSRNDFEQGIRHAMVAVAIRPLSPDARFILLDSMIRHAIQSEKSFSPAISRHAQTLVKLESFQGNTRLLSQWSEFASDAFYDNKISFAKKLSETIALLTPSKSRAPIELGFVYRAIGRPQDALKLFDRNLQILNERHDDREACWALVRKARVYGDLHDYKKAIQLLEQSLSRLQEPDTDVFVSAWIRLELAKLLTHYGDSALSRVMFDKVAESLSSSLESGNVLYGSRSLDRILRDQCLLYSDASIPTDQWMTRLEAYSQSDLAQNEYSLLAFRTLSALVHERDGAFEKAIADYEFASMNRRFLNEMFNGSWMEEKLIELYKKVGSEDRAKRFFGELLRKRNAELPSSHPTQAFTRILLVRVLIDQGQHREQCVRLLGEAQRLVDGQPLFPQHVRDELSELTSQLNSPPKLH